MQQLKKMPTTTREECQKLVRTDPRFTEELPFIPYFWLMAEAGWADDVGVSDKRGQFFEFFVGSDDVRKFPELGRRSVGRRIQLFQASDGAVTGYWVNPVTSKNGKTP